MIVNTLMNSSMTRLEEIPSISSDLLLEREYMTQDIQSIVVFVDH